jgi:MFS family permease
MVANTSKPDYKDRTRVIAVIGVVLLLVGIAVGFLGPLEMYCFYLFAEGGRFHYEGFGFGSFMFGNIASQIVGYYLIAAALIPLGYGHLKMRRWARTLALTLLWSWLVVGAPLIVVVFFILVGSKDLSVPAALIALVFLGLSYLVFPALLIRFYRGRNVKRTFETHDGKSYWIEALPMPILVLSSLYLFYTVVLHLLILFNGMFPVFGAFAFGLQGILLLDISIACLICLVWGTLRRRMWAWWGGVIFFSSFTFSTLLTFFRASYSTILSGLAFPPREIEFLGGLPVQGYHFAVLAGIPLLITWGAAIFSRRHFGTGQRVLKR